MRKMKDSGIEWIGQIPSDWDVSKIKYHCSMQSGDNLTSSDIEPEGEYEVYGANGFRGYYSRFNCEGVHILVGRQGALAGNVHLVDGRYWATDHAVITKITDKTCVKFLYYSLVSADLNQYAFETAAQPGLAVSVIVNKSVPIPPIDEQKKIADFLDEKCGEIDSIRSDVQREIEILNDYKKSVITEAVTKGLNPKAKLKDSGIEWIEKIPEGWNVKKLKYLCCTITDGSHFSPETTQEGKTYITVSDVYNDKIHYEEAAKISEEDFFILERNGCRPPKGAVLLSKDGTVGRTAIVSDNDYVVLSSLGILVPNLNVINSSYLKYLLDSPYLQEQMKLSMAGSALRRITISKISRFIGIVPPLPEQKTIADYLDEKCSEINATIADKQKQLETLDEYNKSLIFEYVTGKKEVPA